MKVDLLIFLAREWEARRVLALRVVPRSRPGMDTVPEIVFADGPGGTVRVEDGTKPLVWGNLVNLVFLEREWVSWASWKVHDDKVDEARGVIAVLERFRRWCFGGVYDEKEQPYPVMHPDNRKTDRVALGLRISEWQMALTQADP